MNRADIRSLLIGLIGVIVAVIFIHLYQDHLLIDNIRMNLINQNQGQVRVAPTPAPMPTEKASAEPNK